MVKETKEWRSQRDTFVFEPLKNIDFQGSYSNFSERGVQVFLVHPVYLIA